MPSWEELRRDFRDLEEPLKLARLDSQSGSDGEYWRLAGVHQDAAVSRRFEALAGLAGRNLRLSLGADERHKEPIFKGEDPALWWYRALKEIGKYSRFSGATHTLDEQDRRSGSIVLGSIDQPAQASATFCLELESRGGDRLSRSAHSDDRASSSSNVRPTKVEKEQSLVFVSWSGDLSRDVALVLGDWLPTALEGISTWVSSRDIAKGARWSEEIATCLDSATYGIACVVPGNQEAPWLLFEAGAVAKSVETGRISPFLLGVEPSELPSALGQFQCTSYLKEEVLRLLLSINDAPDGPKRPVERVRKSFDASWPVLKARLLPLQEQVNTLGASNAQANGPHRTLIVRWDSGRYWTTNDLAQTLDQVMDWLNTEKGLPASRANYGTYWVLSSGGPRPVPREELEADVEDLPPELQIVVIAANQGEGGGSTPATGEETDGEEASEFELVITPRPGKAQEASLLVENCGRAAEFFASVEVVEVDPAAGNTAGFRRFKGYWEDTRGEIARIRTKDWQYLKIATSRTDRSDVFGTGTNYLELLNATGDVAYRLMTFVGSEDPDHLLVELQVTVTRVAPPRASEPKNFFLYMYADGLVDLVPAIGKGELDDEGPGVDSRTPRA